MAQVEEPPVDNTVKEQNESTANVTEIPVANEPEPAQPSEDKEKPSDNISAPQEPEPTEPPKDNKIDIEKPIANITDDTKQETDKSLNSHNRKTKNELTENNITIKYGNLSNNLISAANKLEQAKKGDILNKNIRNRNDILNDLHDQNILNKQIDPSDNEQQSKDDANEENHNENENEPQSQDDNTDQKLPSNDTNITDNTKQETDNEPQSKDDAKQENNNENEPQSQDDNTDQKSPSNDPNDTDNKDNEPNDNVASDEQETKTIEISQEEKDIYIQINNEKESITKSINNMVGSLAKFETDSEQKKTIINDTFGSLINMINNRKTALLNELNNEILTQKSDALKQIESMKQYQQTINNVDAKYQSLTNTQQNDDEKIQPEQRKEQILSLPKQFDASFAKMTFDADIKLRLDTEALETALNSFGSARIGLTSDPDYDEEKVPSFIDTNAELLLAEIPVKKLYRWGKKSGSDFSWRPRAQRTIIFFYQNKKSYKVRMVVKENESEEFLLNQWVHTNELVEKEALVWIWSAFDATVAKEAGDEKKGYTKWCAKFFDDVAFERFQDQYNQARKINIQVLENEEKIRKNKLKQERLRKQTEEEDVNVGDDEAAVYYENDEKLCYEMDVWKTYLWGKDAAGKGAWKSYAEKSLLQFFENRKNKKIRIVVRENETKQLKLNHWIPTDCSLKSRGDQMWEWQVYDDLATKFLKNSTLKLATICGTFIDKKDTEKFKELFDKYQKINQQAEAL